MNWTESADGVISFGHGYARRDVLVDIGTLEEEIWRFRRACGGFLDAVAWTYGDEQENMVRRREAVVPGLYQLDLPVAGPSPATATDGGADEGAQERWEAWSVEFSEGEEMEGVESSALY